MRGFWWWERDAQVLEQIRLYREERLRQKQERREDRREKRDYVAIGIALFAAAFTCWQAWEAHQTRKDTQVQFEQAQRRADRDANQVRIDAKEAVDAQTKLADRSAEQAKQSADAAREQLKVAKDQAISALGAFSFFAASAMFEPPWLWAKSCRGSGPPRTGGRSCAPDGHLIETNFPPLCRRRSVRVRLPRRGSGSPTNGLDTARH